MKKNILFIMPSLAAGGGEKSLVNLLSQIDFSLYSVDLFLLNNNGIFLNHLPKEVKIINFSTKYKLFTLPLKASITQLLRSGYIHVIYPRIMYSLFNRILPNNSKREQKVWKFLSKGIEVIEKKYDIAVGFLEKTSIYMCVDQVKAERKIGWIHNDYDQLGMDPKFDKSYFEQLDNIITVSEECFKILKKRFPEYQKKIELMYNIVSPKVINDLANQETGNLFEKRKDEVILLSIGRLHYQKGFDKAIEACKILIDKGNKVKWYILGDGDERGKLEILIKEKELEGHFVLLGIKANPYPYIQQADLYVQSSRYEGKSIAIDEAKILKKPILVTNFSTAKDQIKNHFNGIIVEKNPMAIANGIEQLINDENLKRKLVSNLINESLGTEYEIKKFYKIIGDYNEKKETFICN